MERTINSKDVVAGQILWLPPSNEVPDNAVKRVCGSLKAPVDKGMYNHPIVVCSRPCQDIGSTVHFHLITSFHGKTLEEKYGKKSEYQRIRRRSYLPISPAPDHPDGLPMLFLGLDRKLRWNSYVKFGEVYEISLENLWAYADPTMPVESRNLYHLGKKSVKALRTVAERSINYHIDLVQFAAGTDFPNRTFGGRRLKPSRISTEELEDLEISEQGRSYHTIRPVLIDKLKNDYLAPMNVVTNHSHGSRADIQGRCLTEPMVCYHEEVDYKLGNRLNQSEATTFNQQPCWTPMPTPERSTHGGVVRLSNSELNMPNISKDLRNSDSLSPETQAAATVDHSIPPKAFSGSIARGDHNKGWLDSYIFMITYGLKKVVDLAKWTIRSPSRHTTERDYSSV